VESSFDAWTKFYKQDENAVNAIVSYYNKGALAVLCLDLIIRRESGGERSLDDVMRALWREYGKPGVGVPEDGVEQLAMAITNIDLRGFFERALRSREELPLRELLESFAIDMQLRPATGLDDKGGCLPIGSQQAISAKPSLGLTLAAGDSVRVASVYDDGPAQQAGISAGDTIVAINGLRAERGDFEKLIGAAGDGGEVELYLFRRDELMRFRAKPEIPPDDTCDLALLMQSDAQSLKRRKPWLSCAAPQAAESN